MIEFALLIFAWYPSVSNRCLLRRGKTPKEFLEIDEMHKNYFYIEFVKNVKFNWNV